MRRLFGLGGLLGGAWLFASPWALPSTITTNMGGGMTADHMMTQTTSQVVINASTYYWHIVPGILAILVSAAVIMFSAPALMRGLAVALGVLAVWSAAGPWVLPQLGMGSMMSMGLTGGSFLRHVVPGIVLAICAGGVFFTASNRSSQEVRTEARVQS